MPPIPKRTLFLFLTASLMSVSFLGGCAGNAGMRAQAVAPKRVIVFVWDGLRPDSINATDTPKLFALMRHGVRFSNNHATYPTFTMMNAASFATGAFPGHTGFYGNTLYRPGTVGNNAGGAPVDFGQPVFTEDYAILEDLNKYYDNQLLLIGTLFQAAQKAGLKTAAIGKSGPAFMQDYQRGGMILDEKTVFPLALARKLQQAGYALPKTTPHAYAPGVVALSAHNGDPTAADPLRKLRDGTASDPTDASGSPYKQANQYMMNVYTDYVLPREKPDLSVVWFRNPDSTEHVYGPGSANYRDALRAQDALLGQLQDRLATLHLDGSTDLIVVSDHGHSSVSGDPAWFPLRGIRQGEVDRTGTDPRGYSVSGDVRTADLLTRAGFGRVFDGGGCSDDPVMSGIKADGTTVYPRLTDHDGRLCGKPGARYTTPSFKVPARLPTDAIVIAPNGGSDYLYVPNRDGAMVRKLIAFLQSRSEYGAIFVDSRYGRIPGTLPLSTIRVENAGGRNPDIIVSFQYDEDAVVQGMRGIEYESMFNLRGMHGSFSPIDVHNTLIASGPDFRLGYTDTLPSGNVDVAPTIAAILGLSMPNADGRPLLEALRNGKTRASDYQLRPMTVSSDSVPGLAIRLPTDPDGGHRDTGKSSYTFQLRGQVLTHDGKTYTYFDAAKASRQ